jgi:hypothetical protein
MRIAIVAILLVAAFSLHLHHALPNSGELEAGVLEKIWEKLEYLEGTFSYPSTTWYKKDEWLQRYEQFFDVPQWLAEEKFGLCDWDHNLVISHRELECF